MTIRLAPVVPLKVALTSFPSVADAVTAVVEILGAGLTPTSLELLDGTSIRGLNLAKLLPDALPEEPTVLMRFSNPSEAVNRASLEAVATIVKRAGARELKIARDEKENDELWKARKVRPASSRPGSASLLTCSPRATQSQYWSQQLLIGKGCRTLVRAGTAWTPVRQADSSPRRTATQITDVCVPISRLAEFVARSEVLVQRSGLVAPIVCLLYTSPSPRDS